MSYTAYVAPCRRNNSNSNNSKPHVGFYSNEVISELDELRKELTIKNRELDELSRKNNQLIQDNRRLTDELNMYTSKDPKVSKQDYDKLNKQYEDYKTMKYKEFQKIKDKLNSHDELVRELNKNIAQLEDKLKHSNQDVERYKSAIHDLNQRIRDLKQQQTILKPIEPKPEPQITEPQPLQNEQFIQDDWGNVIKCIDYVLSLDKKIISSLRFDIPSIKMTRSLIKQ